MRWVHYRPKARMHALDKVFPEGIHIPDYFAGRNIVHLPTVKCHIYTGTTGAMKNAFGGLLNKHRHYTHSWIHETLVDLLAIQREIHPGIFAVMDATTAGNGPTVTPIPPTFSLGSARVNVLPPPRKSRRQKTPSTVMPTAVCSSRNAKSPAVNIISWGYFLFLACPSWSLPTAF